MTSQIPIRRKIVSTGSNLDERYDLLGYQRTDMSLFNEDSLNVLPKQATRMSDLTGCLVTLFSLILATFCSLYTVQFSIFFGTLCLAGPSSRVCRVLRLTTTFFLWRRGRGGCGSLGRHTSSI